MTTVDHPYRATVARALTLLDDPAQIEQAKALLQQLLNMPEEVDLLLQPRRLTSEQRVYLDNHPGVQALLQQLATEAEADDEEELFEANPDGSPSDRRAS
jgi:hypothetical protein